MANGEPSDPDEDGELQAALLSLLLRSPSNDMRARAHALFSDLSELPQDERQLYIAITEGDEPKVRELLSHGVGGLQTDHELNPLIMAAIGGRLGIVRMLLAAHAKVDVRDSKLWTPLHYACHQGHVEVVKALLDAGADIEAKDNLGCPPLLVCCIMGTVEAALELLSGGADPNATDNDGFTAIQSAIGQEHPELVRLLLMFNADPKSPDTYGDTALHLACSKDDPDPSVVDLLLEHGADPNAARIDDGLTPLYGAVVRGHEAMLKSLLSRGADPNWRNAEHHITPLHAGAINQLQRVSPETIKLLLQHEADPNLPDDRGRTPLISAIVSNSHGIVEILIAEHAEVDAQEESGMRALHFAVTRNQIEDVRALLTAHADPNAAVPDNNATSLLIAAMNGAEECAQALIDEGADVTASIQVQEGLKTPLLCSLTFREQSRDATAVVARAVVYQESRAWPSELPNFSPTSVFGRWPGKLPSSLNVFPTAMPGRTDEQTPPWEVFKEKTCFEPPSEPRSNLGGSSAVEEEPKVTSEYFRDVNDTWTTDHHRLIAELLEKMAPEGYDVSGLRRSLLNSAELAESMRSGRGEDVDRSFEEALRSLCVSDDDLIDMDMFS